MIEIQINIQYIIYMDLYLYTGEMFLSYLFGYTIGNVRSQLIKYKLDLSIQSARIKKRAMSSSINIDSSSSSSSSQRRSYCAQTANHKLRLHLRVRDKDAHNSRAQFLLC